MKRKVLLYVLPVLILGTLLLLLQTVDFSACDDGMADSWIGRYSFYESTPSAANEMNLFWSYKIEIYEDGEKLYAVILVGGHLVWEHFRAEVSGDCNSISLVYDGYIPADEPFNVMPFRCKVGDVVLSFERHGDDIITIWGGMGPVLDENESPGIHFVKTTSSPGDDTGIPSFVPEPTGSG